MTERKCPPDRLHIRDVLQLRDNLKIRRIQGTPAGVNAIACKRQRRSPSQHGDASNLRQVWRSKQREGAQDGCACGHGWHLRRSRGGRACRLRGCHERSAHSTMRDCGANTPAAADEAEAVRAAVDVPAVALAEDIESDPDTLAVLGTVVADALPLLTDAELQEI